MEYLRYLGNLSFSPILILTMGIVGLVLSTFIKSIVEIILVKPFGMKVTDFSIFGFKFSRSRSGKWESRGRKPSVGLEVYTSFDLEKTAGTDSKKLIANEKAYLTVVGIVTLVLGIVVFAGLLVATFSVSSFALASVFFFIGAWTLAFDGSSKTDYREFLRRFRAVREEVRIDPDSFETVGAGMIMN